MSVVHAIQYRCDRPDCAEHVELVLRDLTTTADRLRAAGWSFSTADGVLRHFCPQHCPDRPTKKTRLHCA